MIRAAGYTTTTPEHVGRFTYIISGGSLARETMTPEKTQALSPYRLLLAVWVRHA